MIGSCTILFCVKLFKNYNAFLFIVLNHLVAQVRKRRCRMNRKAVLMANVVNTVVVQN